MTVENPKTTAPKDRLRRADFKTGVLLGLISAYMLYTALGYPLQESYGGVENSWYVSPALFPILIASLLLIFAVVLTANALRYAVRNNLTSYFMDYGQLLPGSKSAKLFLVLLYIGGYTYVLIERVDFVIATGLFLLGFIGAFFVVDGKKITRNASLYGFYCLLCWGFVGLWPDFQSAPFYFGDGIGLIAMANLYWFMRKPAKNDGSYRWRLRVTLLTSVVTALLIAISFRFGLLVPLPKEGIVLELMHELRGLLR